MNWVKPNKPIRPAPAESSPWSSVGACLLALLLGIVVAALSLLLAKASLNTAAGLGVIGLVLSLCGILGLQGLAFERPWLETTLWNRFRSAELLYWHQQINRYLLVLGSHVVSAEPMAAARILGLEPTPPEAGSAVQHLYKENSLSAERARFERLCEDLLLPLKSQLLALKGQEVEVWLQTDIARWALEETVLQDYWAQHALPKPIAMQMLPNDQTLVQLQMSWIGSRRVHLVLSMQYHTDQDKPEWASALLLAPDHLTSKLARVPRCKLFLPMASRIECFDEDLKHWLNADQQSKDKIRILWQNRLSKTNRHALESKLPDLGLALRQTAPAFGMVDLNQSLGKMGASGAWLNLGMATEMAQCHQGVQGLILQDDHENLTLQMIGMDPPEPQPLSEGECEDYTPMSISILGLGALCSIAVIWFAWAQPFLENYWFIAAELLVFLGFFSSPFWYYRMVEQDVLREFNQYEQDVKGS